MKLIALFDSGIRGELCVLKPTFKNIMKSNLRNTV